MSVTVESKNVQEIIDQELSLLVRTYDRFPVLFERGDGVYLYDSQGKQYLDLLSGIGVCALGHAHPAVTKTITEQAAKLLHTSNLFYHPYQAALAKKLTAISGLDRAFFCNSGSEAWEAGLKLARAYAKRRAGKATAKTKILVMENSFHGRTYGSLSTTGQKKYRDPYKPLVGGITFVKFNNVPDLRKKFDSTVCAIGLEMVQGEGGIQPVSQEFADAVRRLTARSGALLIVDEIQSGLGRTGKCFAYQHYGITPDVVTLAKPIANGLPLGAMLATNAAAEGFAPGMHGTTFGGGPLACAVANTVVPMLTSDQMLDHVRATGAYFKHKLEELKARHSAIVNVRGLGLMLAAELNSADLAKTVVRQMLDRGVVINRTHDTVLRFLPPFILENDHIDHAVKTLGEVLEANAQSANPKGAQK